MKTHPNLLIYSISMMILLKIYFNMYELDFQTKSQIEREICLIIQIDTPGY